MRQRCGEREREGEPGRDQRPSPTIPSITSMSLIAILPTQNFGPKPRSLNLKSIPCEEKGPVIRKKTLEFVVEPCPEESKGLGSVGVRLALLM